MARTLRNLVIGLVFGGTLVGCSSLQPWVPPYERGLLVDPMMNVARDPIANKHRQHVFDTREAARGAVTSEGGGCGCN